MLRNAAPVGAFPVSVWERCACQRSSRCSVWKCAFQTPYSHFGSSCVGCARAGRRADREMWNQAAEAAVAAAAAAWEDGWDEDACHPTGLMVRCRPWFMLSPSFGPNCPSSRARALTKPTPTPKHLRPRLRANGKYKYRNYNLQSLTTAKW